MKFKLHFITLLVNLELLVRNNLRQGCFVTSKKARFIKN